MALIIRPFSHQRSISLIEAGFGDLATSSSHHVVIGDTIDVDEQDGYLRGHGTRSIEESGEKRLIATLCGVVMRVNKLVYVRPLKSRYSAEQGDVIVGRITEVSMKRWKVDLKSRQEAGLLLSAVNLPGGIQRRRNAEDELNMRSLYSEGDLISAEVQQVHSDGSVALHTRSVKYGKLLGGQLVIVPAKLIKKQKQHFYAFEAIGVSIILGCNGLVWVYSTPLIEGEPVSSALADKNAMEIDEASSASSASAQLCAKLTKDQMESAVRVANCIRSLASLYFLIHPTSIKEAYELSVERNISLQEMLSRDEFSNLLIRNEAQRMQVISQGVSTA